MVKSMTGYGKAVASLETGKLTVEIRTLNGKNAEIGIKSGLLPKDKELGIRQKIANSLYRGTIDVFLTWEPNASDTARLSNVGLAKEYYNQINTLAKELGCWPIPSSGSQDLLSNILRLPDVVDSQRQDLITEENWPVVDAAFDAALEAVNKYRSDEGKVLYGDVTSRIRNILELEDEVESYEQQRIDAVREKLMKNLQELSLSPDKERFEQEIIYYLEKLDINEEKVRLRQNCHYFLDTINGEEFPGKKLGFIIQEIGREINTTGSKANHALIQKAVVRMKDELEKMREQSMNIL